jgi:pimeloyl-ACP methyl ester carboxylesterase
MLFWLELTAGILGITGAAVVWWRFVAALRMHRARVTRGSQVVSSRFGQIEFATVGHGAPVLVSHGGGGGFDQVVAAADRLIAAGYQIVAPSRFGFLRSASPNDPSPGNQADAFAALLDALHIQSLPVVGISVGTLAALQFAVRHPDRCRSLTVIVPAASAVLAAQGPLPDQSPIAKAIIWYIASSDFLFWLGMTLARDRMIRSMLATDPAVVASASPPERQRALNMLWNLMPISQRSQGFLNDVRFASAPQSIAVEEIKAPTLVVSLEDDFFRTLAPARFIAAHVPGARLLTYASGGHVWVGHDAELFAEVEAFLKQHSDVDEPVRSATNRSEVG